MEKYAIDIIAGVIIIIAGAAVVGVVKMALNGFLIQVAAMNTRIEQMVS